MSSKDLQGRMGFPEMSDSEHSASWEPKGKGSESNFLGLGQATFISMDGLWSREGGSDDSGDSFEFQTVEFSGSPNSAHSRSPLSTTRSRSPFSIVTGESDVDQLIADLKEQNDNLRLELDSMQQREVDLGYKLELAEDRLQQEIVVFEENASMKSDESRDDSQGSSKRSGAPGVRESSSNYELQYSFTQNDELQFTKEKLAETEEKLRLMSEKVAKSARSKDPPDGGIEEALARAVEAEQKLVEREDDLVQLYKFTEDLEQKHEELEGNVIIHKKEADELRRQLAKKEQDLEENVARRLAAESEVTQWEKGSLQLSRETEELREENMRLKEAVTELSRKSKSELSKSEESVSSLQSDAEEMTSVVYELKSEVTELNAQLHDTVTQFQESEERFNKIQEESENRIADLQRENMQLRESLVEVEQQGQIERSSSQEEHLLSMQSQVEEMEKTIKTLSFEVNERSSQLLVTQDSFSKKCEELQEVESKVSEMKAADSAEIARLQEENTKLMESLYDLDRQSQSKLEAANDQVQDLKARVEEMSSKLQTVQSEAEVRESQLKAENARIQQALDEREKKCESDLQASAERVVDMQIQTNEMKRSIQALESEVDERSNQLLESQASLADKTKQLQETKDTFTQEVESLKGLSVENEELKDALAKSKHHAQIERLEASGRIEELQKEVDAMTRTIRKLRADAEASSSRLLEHQSDLAGKVLLLEQAEESLRSIQGDNERLKKELVEAEEKSRSDLKASEEQVTDLQSQIEEMEKVVEDLESNIKVRSTELRDSEAFAADKSKQHQEAVERLEESRATLADTSKQLKVSEESLKALRQEKLQLKGSLEEVEKKRFNDIKASQTRVTGLKSQAEQMEQRIESLQTELAKKATELQESEVSSVEKSKQLQELEAQLASKEDLLTDKSKQLEEAESAYAVLRQETTDVKNSLVELQKKSASELEESQESVAKLQLQLDEMTKASEALRSDVETRSLAITETETALSDKSKQLEEAETQLAKSKESLAELSEQLNEAVEMSATLQEENAQLKESLLDIESKNDLEKKPSQERVSNLQDQADASSTSIEELRSDIDEGSLKIQKFEIVLAEKSKKLEEAGATLTALCQENVKIKEVYEKSGKQAQHELQEAQERCTGLQAQVDEMETVIRDLQVEVDEKKEELLRSQISLAEKSTLLQKAEGRYKKLQDESLRHFKAFAEVEKQSRRYVATAQERFVALRKEADEIAKAKQLLQNDFDKRSSQHAESQKSLAEKSQQLDETREALAGLEQESKKLRESLSDASKNENDLAESKEEVAALKTRYGEVVTRAQELNSTIEQQASQLDESRSLVSEETARRKEAEAELVELQRENDKLAEALANAEERAEHALAEKSQQLDETRVALAGLEQETKELRGSLSDGRKSENDLAVSKEEVAALKARYDEVVTRAQELNSTIEQQVSELDESRSIVSEKTARLKEAEAELVELQRENDKLAEALANAEERAQHAVQHMSLPSESVSRAAPSLQHAPCPEHTRLLGEDGEPRVDESEPRSTNDATVGSATDLVPRDAEAKFQASTDEMSRTIQALRSQVEERTVRLIERKKGSKRQNRQFVTRQENRRLGIDELKRRTDGAHSASALRGELLHNLQQDMQNALMASKETIHRLEQEVANWKKVAADNEKSLETCQSEFSMAKEELQKTISTLDDALAREEALQSRVSELEKTKILLESKLNREKELKEEALSNVNEKLDAMRREYEAVIEDMKEVVSKELSEADAEVSCLVEMHDALLKDYEIKNDQFNDTLASYKEMTDSPQGAPGGRTLPTIDESVEESTSMDEIDMFRSINSSDLESCGASGQMIEMSELNKKMLDAIEGMRQELAELQDENDNLQRQLEAKFGLFSKIQGQFESLQKEYNAVLIENRALRKDNSSISSLQKCVVSAITGSTEALSATQTTASPAMSKKESQRKIESLTREKRELVARSTSAVADMQKAEHEAWHAKQKITKLKKELRAANIAKSALQLCLDNKNSSISHNRSEESCKENETKDEKTLNMSKSDELLVTDGDVRVSSPSKKSQADRTSGASGSELLVNDVAPKPVSPEPLAESASGASQESHPQVECTLSPTELGAELSISDGTSPPLSPMSEVKKSVSEDESIEEVECTLGFSSQGTTVMVNDVLAATPSAMIVVAMPAAPVAPQEPSLVEAKSPQDLATAAMVAKLLSHHEMRYLNETRPLQRPISKPPLVLEDKRKPKSLEWKGYYESEQLSNNNQEGTTRINGE